MKNRKRIVNLLVLGAGLILCFSVFRFTSLSEYASAQYIRQAIEHAGYFGIFVFVLAFCAGVMIQVPGLVFISLAVVLYGRWMGPIVAWGGAVAAVSVGFIMVRAVGGNVLSEIKSPWARRIFSRLESQPVLTIFLLRLVLIVNPPITYALALTSVDFRSFFLGSMLGLLPPIAVVSLFIRLAV